MKAEPERRTKVSPLAWGRCPSEGPTLLVAPADAPLDGLEAILRERRLDLLSLAAQPDRLHLARAVRWLRRGGAVLAALGDETSLDSLRLLGRAAAGKLVPVVAGAGDELDVRLGTALSPTRIPQDDLIDHLDLRLRLLQLAGKAKTGELTDRWPEPVAEPEPREALLAEIDALPAERLLLSRGRQRVFYARAEEIPHMLREIGREREATFRAVAEGSGQGRDLDRFDDHYLHLFIWNDRDEQLVGAYRMGPSESILAEHGPSGLYNAELFQVDPAMFTKLGPALELGRSFVSPRYQGSFGCLLMLFRGVGAWMNRHREYRYIFGALSISADFQDSSRYLMQHFLMQQVPDAGLRELVRPPFALQRPGTWGEELDRHLARHRIADLDDLAAAVLDLEHGCRVPPVLLREYLRLGARVLGTGVDPDFGHTLDALVLVDLAQTDDVLLHRYLGPEVAEYARERWTAPASA